MESWWTKSFAWRIDRLELALSVNAPLQVEDSGSNHIYHMMNNKEGFSGRVNTRVYMRLKSVYILVTFHDKLKFLLSLNPNQVLEDAVSLE